MNDSDDLILNPKLGARNRRRFFFKYMAYDTAYAVLHNQTLRWSTPSILNDPFDMNFKLNIDVDFDRVKSLILDQIWHDHFGASPAVPGNKLGAMIALSRRLFAAKGRSISRDEFDAYFESAIDDSISKVLPGVETAHRQIRPMLDRTKVLCLASQPDNMLMWSHYAQQHSGAVFRFENLTKFDSPYCMAREVIYEKFMPRWMDEQGLADLLSGRTKSDPESIFEKLILTKSYHWSYESEWRVYSGFGRDLDASFEDLRFAGPELDSVIFGCRMVDSNRLALENAAKRINPLTRFWDAKPSRHEFRMEIVERE